MYVELLVVFLYAVCCLIGSFMASTLWNMLRERSYFSLERRVKALENSLAGSVSVDKKAERSERFQEAAAQALAIMQDKSIEPDVRNQKLMSLAAQYPDVALQLVKKFGGVSI